MNVTFIGLGIMGSRMARNLLQKRPDINLTVFNRSQAPVHQLVSEGAADAASLSEAVEEADIVFSMLSTPEVVEQHFTGPNGILSEIKKGGIWVDCSTVNPSFSREMGELAASHGIDFLDAPVAGTKPHAENGELVFFVGGKESTVNEVQSLLEVMGKKVVHIGKVSQGSSFKMLVNIMLAQSMVIFSEAAILGQEMGLSREFLLNALPNLPVAAPFTKAKSEMIKADDYEVQFPLEWMHKDLHLALKTAYEHTQPMYLAALTEALFAEANQAGLGRLDFAVIHKFLEEKRAGATNKSVE